MTIEKNDLEENAEQRLCRIAYESLKLMRKLEIVPDRRLAKMIKTFPLSKYK